MNAPVSAYLCSLALNGPYICCARANDTECHASSAKIAAAIACPHGARTRRAMVTSDSATSATSAPIPGSRKRRYHHSS